MRRLVKIRLAFCVIAPFTLSIWAWGWAQVPAKRPDKQISLALVDATVIDQVAEAPVAHSTILIEGERIAAIFPAGSRPLPAGATVLNLSGRYVIPGLIDTHVHLATDPAGDDSRALVERRLAVALRGGVTTVRDMAGDTRALSDLARDARSGAIPSPDIYYSALFAGPSFFEDPRAQMSARGQVAGKAPWMRSITSTTDLRAAVGDGRRTGATGIKLYATLDGTLAKRITTEAHRQGMRVWAHAALKPATPLEVVNAGVDVVSHASLLRFAMRRETIQSARQAGEHGQPLDLSCPELDTLFAAMREHHTLFEPTLFVDSGDSAHLAFATAITKLAFQAGVPLVAGTDSIVGAADSLPNIQAELQLLVDGVGLTPLQALRATTRDAARAIGIQESCGTLEPGKLADLVVLSGDPLRDIRNTRRVEVVVKRGKIHRRE